MYMYIYINISTSSIYISKYLHIYAYVYIYINTYIFIYISMQCIYISIDLYSLNLSTSIGTISRCWATYSFPSSQDSGTHLKTIMADSTLGIPCFSLGSSSKKKPILNERIPFQWGKSKLVAWPCWRGWPGNHPWKPEQFVLLSWTLEP